MTEPSQTHDTSTMRTAMARDYEETEGLVDYAEFIPSPGTLLLFPGWLSHSVAPHFGIEPRISFASN